VTLPFGQIQHAAGRPVDTATECGSPWSRPNDYGIGIMVSTFGCTNGRFFPARARYLRMARDGLFFNRAVS